MHIVDYQGCKKPKQNKKDTMKTINDLKKMRPEQVGDLTRLLDELKQQVDSGAISFGWACTQVRKIIKGASNFNIAALKTFDTVRIGIWKDRDQLHEAFYGAGYKRVSGHASTKFLSKEIIYTQGPCDAELVAVTPRELGFNSEDCRLGTILDYALGCGLSGCPDEVAPNMLIFRRSWIKTIAEKSLRISPELQAPDWKPDTLLFGISLDKGDVSLSAGPINCGGASLDTPILFVRKLC